MKPANVLYAINAKADLRDYHKVIVAAIANNGEFGEDFADIFKLTKTPEGSFAEWILDFA